jgi:hypothetical protein
MKPLALVLAAALLAAPLAPALAQPDKLERQAPPISPDQDAAPTTPVPQGDEGPGEGSSLSNRLSHSNGVVTPPATGDKGVLVPPPAGAQSTPVIHPPGSTNSPDEPVQPK